MFLFCLCNHRYNLMILYELVTKLTSCGLHGLSWLTVQIVSLSNIWTSLTGMLGPSPTNSYFQPTPSLSCSAVGGTSCLVLVSWHPYRLVMSGVDPPNQVPFRPHYSHFYLLHIAAVHHLMMLDPATDGARQAGSCSLSG